MTNKKSHTKYGETFVDGNLTKQIDALEVQSNSDRYLYTLMQIWPEAPKKKRHKRKLTRWFHIPYLWFTNEEILRINQNVVCHQQQHYPNCHRWAVSGRNMRPKTILCHNIRRENICQKNKIYHIRLLLTSEITNNTLKRIWDLKPFYATI